MQLGEMYYVFNIIDVRHISLKRRHYLEMKNFFDLFKNFKSAVHFSKPTTCEITIGSNFVLKPNSIKLRFYSALILKYVSWQLFEMIYKLCKT